MSSSISATAHARSLYRSILRELPARPKTQPPTPLRASVRRHFFVADTDASSQRSASASITPEYALARRQEAEQFVQYLKAQRMYGTLIERYNPGMGMDEEERVRLTARRVGMDMPEEWYGKAKK